MSSESDHPRSSLAKLRIERPPEPAQSNSSGSRFLRRLVWLGVALLVVGGGFYGALRVGLLGEASTWLSLPEAMQAKPEVRLASVVVEAGQAADATVVASGYLESRRQAKIGARAPGRIEVVNVEEGSRVHQNEILAVLEHADLDASLSAARATLAGNQAQLSEQTIEIERMRLAYERAQKTRESKSISEAEYERAKFDHESAVARRDTMAANVQLATARVAEAEQMKENMYIRAPFEGTVISKDAEVGESILPGGMGEASGRGSVVTIADLDHLEVDCDVKEDYISRIFVDQPAEVAVDAVPDRRYQGRVRKVIPMGDRARATIKVKVAILDADARLFPDMSSTVYFLPTNQPTTIVDQAKRRVFCAKAAIRNDDSQSFVWILNDQDRLERVNVEVGSTRDDRTEILSGLTGSERVVIAPDTVRDGQTVKVVE